MLCFGESVVVVVVYVEVYWEMIVDVDCVVDEDVDCFGVVGVVEWCVGVVVVVVSVVVDVVE